MITHMRPVIPGNKWVVSLRLGAACSEGDTFLTKKVSGGAGRCVLREGEKNAQWGSGAGMSRGLLCASANPGSKPCILRGLLALPERTQGGNPAYCAACSARSV